MHGTAWVADAMADASARVRRSTVDLRIDDGAGDGAAGAGIVWNDEGLIITNAHVVSNRGRVSVRDEHGKAREARIVSVDVSRDLAALQCAPEGLVPAVVADHVVPRPGQLVLSVGSPRGVVGAVAVGVVHGIDRGADGFPDYIRTSIRLAPGNSGGPLADMQGRVLGVNSMIVGGVGVARGEAAVRRFLRRARTGRSLGVVLRPVSVRRHRVISLGLVVTQVRQSSAAARAGILSGDLLVAINGQPFSDPAALSDGVDALEGEQTLQLEVGRAGKIRVVTLPASYWTDLAA